MLKSITAASALGAIAALCATIAPAPASAGIVVTPCYRSGAQIVQITNSADDDYPAIAGRCEAPGDPFTVWFIGNGQIVTRFTTASGAGTFTMPMIYAGYNSTQSVIAFDSAAGTHSNTLTVPEPWIS
jgi:hypothetical protein